MIETHMGLTQVGLTLTLTLMGMDLGMGKANAADSMAPFAEAVLGLTALHEEGEGC